MRNIFALFVCSVALTQALPSAPFVDVLDEAGVCYQSECTIEANCRCSSASSPINVTETPQFVSITIDDAVVRVGGYDTYWQTLLSGRTNPDGSSVRATFFVPHEYTDYEVVNILYNAGHEIAVHSISKNSLQEYWRTASLETLIEEFGGQKQILAKFANINEDDIQGVRTPQLQLQGNNSIEAYNASNLSYDSSWPTLPARPLYPYTLDYRSEQQCISGSCPEGSFPGFWVLPIVDLNGATSECNAIANCGQNGTVTQIADWLYGEIETLRSGTRAPLTLMINSIWFGIAPNSFAALQEVLDRLADLDDVFLVSQSDVLEWISNPVPLSGYKTTAISRNAACNPVTCPVLHTTGETRYMRSCVSCPAVYPWLGNPEGNAQDDA